MVESRPAASNDNLGGSEEPEVLALVNGRWVKDGGDLVISAVDPGLLRGDGVFEVIRVYDGVALAVDEHLARLDRSAHALALEFDAGALENECAVLCSALGRRDAYIRLVVTRLGVRLVIAEMPLSFPSVMRLYPVSHAVSPLVAGVKALSYAANCQAKRLAEARGYHDALLVDQDSRVLELPFASFGGVIEGQLTVPPLDLGVLDSITRRMLIDSFDVEIRICTLEQLASATEACVIGTGMEITPVSEIAGVVSFSSAGKVVKAASEAVGAEIGERLAREHRFSAATRSIKGGRL